jgi:putative ABC transport system permease protein
LGAAIPVLSAARLPPAEAMRPEVPWQGSTRRFLEVPWLRRLSQAHRLIARNLQRRPLRTLLTWLGLALGTAVMMMGRFQNDAIDDIVERQYRQAERHDISVAFFEPMAPRVLHELAALPGVITVEPERAVPVLVRYRAARYRTALRGLPADARLRRTMDREGRPIQLPLQGVVLTDYLADLLGARMGDLIELETLDGRRRVLRLPLAGVVGEPFGSQAYLPLASLDRALGEGERVSGAVLAADSRALPALFDALERRPAVAGVDQRLAGIRNFYEGMAKTILTFT